MSNVFSFTGTIGRDAEVRFSPSGLAVLNVSVANNIGFGDKQKTLWVRVTLFGKRAEGSLKDYLLKGQQVFVSGELTQNEYQAKDGTTKTSLELNASIIDLVGRNGDKVQPAAQAQPTPPPRTPTQTNRQPAVPQQAPLNDYPFDDDIPF